MHFKGKRIQIAYMNAADSKNLSKNNEYHMSLFAFDLGKSFFRWREKFQNLGEIFTPGLALHDFRRRVLEPTNFQIRKKANFKTKGRYN